jgi:phosphatidylserine decarboxylase
LVTQIVGPVVRRVVYWLSHETPTPVKAGDRIGMMKFGSRLDIYLPVADVDVLVKHGDRVRAGETVIARTKPAETAEGEMKLKDSEGV